MAEWGFKPLTSLSGTKVSAPHGLALLMATLGMGACQQGDLISVYAAIALATAYLVFLRRDVAGD